MGLQEDERQPARPDRGGDPVHRQPGLLARGGQAQLLDVAGEEWRRSVAGHQDAEVDHPLDLGLRHAGEVGKFGCRQLIHAATIL